MTTRRAARHFGVAFVITVAVVAGAAVLRTARGIDGAPGTSGAIEVVADGSTASASSAPDTIATEEATPVSESSVPDSDTTVSPVRAELPMLDFSRLCRDLEGDGALFVGDGDRFGLVCVTPEGESISIDVRNACLRSYGDGTRAVLIEANSGADAWRCTASNPVEYGRPGWQAECSRRFGASGVAFLLANDSQGWRCASTINGVYAEDEVAPDAACQATFGPESYGEVVGRGPEDNRCYGASA